MDGLPLVDTRRAPVSNCT